MKAKSHHGLTICWEWTDETGKIRVPGKPKAYHGTPEELPDHVRRVKEKYGTPMVEGGLTRIFEWSPANVGLAVHFDLSRTDSGKMKKDIHDFVVGYIADYLTVQLNAADPKIEVFYDGGGGEEWSDIIVAIPAECINDALIDDLRLKALYMKNWYEVLFEANADLVRAKEFTFLCRCAERFDLTEGDADRDKLRALWTAYAIHADLLKEPEALNVMLLLAWNLIQEDFIGENEGYWKDFGAFVTFMNKYIM